MNGGRADCPVLTCTRNMPVDQVMCAHCWAKVPKNLRQKLDGGGKDATRQRRELERQAIAAAQAVTP